MADEENKSCPRCGNLFTCKAGNITECDCYGIRLAADASRWIEQRYNDCLCANCLRQLQDSQVPFYEKFGGGNSGA